VVIGLGATLLIAIVTNLGTPVLAGVTVIVRLDLFAEMLFIALSVGLGATVAQNAGAQRPDRIRAAPVRSGSPWSPPWSCRPG
jgi:Na+-driven multidrug efflux pump